METEKKLCGIIFCDMLKIEFNECYFYSMNGDLCENELTGLVCFCLYCVYVRPSVSLNCITAQHEVNLTVHKQQICFCTFMLENRDG